MTPEIKLPNGRVLKPVAPAQLRDAWVRQSIQWLASPRARGEITGQTIAQLMRPGDQLWQWQYSCGPLCGDTGFALVRNGVVIETVRTTVS